MGDFDPSGFDLERDLREKLERYSGRFVRELDSLDAMMLVPQQLRFHPEFVYWIRLGVCQEDFDLHDLIQARRRLRRSRCDPAGRAAAPRN